MLTRIWPFSHRYQVATDTGWPSGRTVAITASFGLASMSLTWSGSGGLGTGDSLVDWQAFRTTAAAVRSFRAGGGVAKDGGDRDVPNRLRRRLVAYAVQRDELRAGDRVGQRLAVLVREQWVLGAVQHQGRDRQVGGLAGPRVAF